MRNLKYSLGLKVSAFILLFVFLAVSIVGIVFAFYMLDTGMLLGESLHDTNRYRSELVSRGAELANYCSEHLSGTDAGSVPPALRPSDRTDRTNLRFAVFSGERLVYTNLDIGNASPSPAETETLLAKAAGSPGSAEDSPQREVRRYTYETGDEGYDVYLAVSFHNMVEDRFQRLSEEHTLLNRFRLPTLLLLPFFLVFSLVLFSYLTASTGFRAASDKPVLYALDRIPTDLFVFLLGLLFLIPVYLYALALSESSYMGVTIGISASFLAYSISMESYLSIVRRIRNGVLLKNTLVYKFGRFIGDVFSNLPVLLRLFAFVFGLFFLNLFGVLLVISSASIITFLFVFVIDILAFIYLCYMAIGFDRIRKTAVHISMGDVSCKVETRALMGDVLKLANSINSIGDGLGRSVELQLKSERMKTDLIANVSHDLRTPLTSIVSYIDLIRKEPDMSNTIREYTDILSAKAQQLRQLADDLIDASKTSSGNIAIQYERINLYELINQSLGEYADRFNSRGLTLILSIPEQQAHIRADGRHMWRVLENLFSNLCKYALHSSRVYLDLLISGNHVVLSMKNISENALNISADELLERFVRGDSSRNTEGSGLGLSIARDLVKLQGGVFDITVDGDLFKVSITFPVEP